MRCRERERASVMKFWHGTNRSGILSGAFKKLNDTFGPQVVSKPASARAVASCGSRQKSAGGAAVAPGARRGVPAARRRRCPGRAGWHGPLDVGCWRWGAAGSVSRQGSPRSACHFQSSPRRSALTLALANHCAALSLMPRICVDHGCPASGSARRSRGLLERTPTQGTRR